jgi:catechol 2,3-dioxygenase-like lactoylglutathione lyase family enzyme
MLWWGCGRQWPRWFNRWQFPRFTPEFNRGFFMIKFAHTNLISDDWKRLADFYIKVFGCRPILPERNLFGDWLDKATTIQNAHLRGVHLVLPGYEDNLPTLEIFQYDANLERPSAAANRKGFGHIAFKVDNVPDVLQTLLENGGAQLGEIVEAEIAGAGTVIFVYAQDIDGNIIELQKWKT